MVLAVAKEPSPRVCIVHRALGPAYPMKQGFLPTHPPSAKSDLQGPPPPRYPTKFLISLAKGPPPKKTPI